MSPAAPSILHLCKPSTPLLSCCAGEADCFLISLSTHPLQGPIQQKSYLYAPGISALHGGRCRDVAVERQNLSCAEWVGNIPETILLPWEKAAVMEM